jgi:type I restriction enzyme S subunit
MARALFQSWFVDFDPVKAKLAAVRCGRDPEQAAMAAIACKLVVPPGKPKAETLDAQLPSAEAIDAAIAALDKLSEAQRQSLKEKAAHFPADFQESELGLIPQGWEVGTLSDLSLLNEKSWSNKSHPEQVIYVDLANCKNGYILSVSQFDWKDAPSRARRIVTAGDTIFGTVRPSNRSFALVGESKMQLTASTGFAVLSPRENIFREFLYLSACGDENIDRLTHLADGAAYPAVRPDVVASYEIVIPTIESLKNYSGTTAEFFNQKQYNEHESRTLANLRDALLPKLLSGEIAVSPN